jgi:23S rRNA pseudouridine2605 synthase
MEERLQKILSRAGLGSRRSCEIIIKTGRVRVNGHVAELGSKADHFRDQITVDGALIPKAEPLTYIALYKPRGVLSTVEAPDPRQTVRDLVPVPGTLYPVGRLDADSEGLILLTNDGELADQLTHPKFRHPKEYRVLVARQPDEKQLEAFRHGVVMSDGHRTAPAEAKIETFHGKGAWMNVVLYEGRKRQIRETCSLIGLPVVRIVRIRIATLLLGNLKPNQWRYLSDSEVKSLKSFSSQKPEQKIKPPPSKIQKSLSPIQPNRNPSVKPKPFPGSSRAPGGQSRNRKPQNTRTSGSGRNRKGPSRRVS